VTAGRTGHIQVPGFVFTGMDDSRPHARRRERDWLADQFQAHRPQLRSLGYRMLGSPRDADDAVQETWLRLDRSDTAAINDLRAWLSTVAGRVCLDMLRSRKASREYNTGTWLPEPVVGPEPAEGPEQQAVLADSVGMALLVVLEALTPAERLAFVLHDIFDVPFDQIAPVVDRTPQAARQLASRARRRIQQAPLAVLDPGVVFRADLGPASPRQPVHGARPVARRVLALAPRFARLASPITINGAVGALFGSRDDPIAVIAFTVTGGRIAAIDLIADPGKLRALTHQPGQHQAD
jgi:RNA polymerase sigma-70 factor (ECF subfamily)